MSKRENPFYIVKDPLQNDEEPQSLKALLRYDSTEMLGKFNAVHVALYGLAKQRPRTFSVAPVFERVSSLYDSRLGIQGHPDNEDRRTIRYSGFVADKIQEGQDNYHRRVYGTHFALTHIVVNLVESEPAIEKSVKLATATVEDPPFEAVVLKWRIASGLALTQVDTERESRDLPKWYKMVTNDLHREYLHASIAFNTIAQDNGEAVPGSFSRMPPQVQGLLNPLTTELVDFVPQLRISR